jgi:hypothetical protein
MVINQDQHNDRRAVGSVIQDQACGKDRHINLSLASKLVRLRLRLRRDTFFDAHAVNGVANPLKNAAHIFEILISNQKSVVFLQQTHPLCNKQTLHTTLAFDYNWAYKLYKESLIWQT